MNTTNEDYVFVIMPFGPSHDERYKKIFKKAIKQTGLNSIRADEISGSREIMNKIWDGIKKAKLILADLSTMNPNVYYELGLAVAICKPVILIAEDVSELPFDIKMAGVITKPEDEENFDLYLRDELVENIQKALQSPHSFIQDAFENREGISYNEQKIPFSEPMQTPDVAKKLLSELLREGWYRNYIYAKLEEIGYTDKEWIDKTISELEGPSTLGP